VLAGQSQGNSNPRADSRRLSFPVILGAKVPARRPRTPRRTPRPGNPWRKAPDPGLRPRPRARRRSRSPSVRPSWPAGLAAGLWAVGRTTTTARRPREGRRGAARGTIPAAVPLTGGQGLPEGREDLGLFRGRGVIRAGFPVLDTMAGLVRGVRIPVGRVRECPEGPGLFLGRVVQGRAARRVPVWGGPEPRRPAPCRKTRVLPSAALRPRSRPTPEGIKNLRCRKSSCRPRRR